jgi:hypothetical protein
LAERGSQPLKEIGLYFFVNILSNFSESRVRCVLFPVDAAGFTPVSVYLSFEFAQVNTTKYGYYLYPRKPGFCMMMCKKLKLFTFLMKTF